MDKKPHLITSKNLDKIIDQAKRFATGSLRGIVVCAYSNTGLVKYGTKEMLNVLSSYENEFLHAALEDMKKLSDEDSRVAMDSAPADPKQAICGQTMPKLPFPLHIMNEKDAINILFPEIKKDILGKPSK